MKYYDVNKPEGITTIKVKLQSQNYKGHLILEIKGNLKGLEALSIVRECIDDIYEWDDCMTENHCDFIPYTDNMCVSFTLKTDNNRGKKAFEIELDELTEYIVGLEIINFEPKDFEPISTDD